MRPALSWLVLPLVLIAAAATPARAPYDLSPVTAEVQRLVSVYGLPGATLHLAKGGQPVYLRHFDAYDDSTRIPVASASKWLSALLIARLVEDGRMDWQDTIGDYLPDAPVDKRGITLRQLFSHTSGLPGGESGCLARRDITLDDCARQILQKNLIGTPGQVFSYGGYSMQVAGRLAEVATGQSWDEVFLAEMVLPLGLQGTDFATGSQLPGYIPVNNPRIAGGVRSTAADYARVMAMVAARGAIPGGRFLSPETIDYMALEHSAGATVVSTPFPDSLGYGIGQWREAEDALGVAIRVSSPGAFGTYPFVDWRQSVAGVYLVRGEMPLMKDDEIALVRLCLRQLDFVRYQAPPRTVHTKPVPPRSVTSKPRVEKLDGGRAGL